ncbi:hypothetical protein GRI97_04150 [Altererythrobacter xixiisoli]|uniref:DUF4136 domain-containing protein n=1 Tax=Croceibacterium xixiisoli TaxID=1476466 RepID=A0A6I4TTI7_9SPHN|nr:hypothetical protein [Croceibacterium xixiisoli]MXO98177.1 hypothetical protein [Croceibacterium xixiisoli]
MKSGSTFLSALLLCSLTLPIPAAASWRGDPWAGRGDSGWGRAGSWDRPSMRGSSGRDDREGQVQVEHFEAENARAQLGQGAVVVRTLAGDTTQSRDQSTYEAAVIDQLVKAGYDTLDAYPSGGQIAEIRVIRDVVSPEEEKRNPVSGEMAVGVSNRGSMASMAVNLDFTAARKALLSTRLEARLRDKATDAILWEGRATVMTREGDSHWTEQAISTRLAAALFEDMPARQ